MAGKCQDFSTLPEDCACLFMGIVTRVDALTITVCYPLIWGRF
jgi:hypothetical protein